MFIFPMVGKSSRFFDQGYKLPKYQLNLEGHSIFFHAVNSFKKYFSTDLFLFIARSDFDAEHFIQNELKKMSIDNYQVVILDYETEGQAHTCYEGILKLTNPIDDELYIFNVDTFRLNFSKPSWTSNCDGYLEVFIGEGDGWSFIEPGSNQSVIRTTEKDRISNYCSDGLYYFRKIKLFKDAYLEAKKKKLTVNNEYYVAPLYNLLINQNLNISYELVDKKDVVFCGTPSEYEELVNKPALHLSK